MAPEPVPDARVRYNRTRADAEEAVERLKDSIYVENLEAARVRAASLPTLIDRWADADFKLDAALSAAAEAVPYA